MLVGGGAFLFLGLAALGEHVRSRNAFLFFRVVLAGCRVFNHEVRQLCLHLLAQGVELRLFPRLRVFEILLCLLGFAVGGLRRRQQGVGAGQFVFGGGRSSRSTGIHLVGGGDHVPGSFRLLLLALFALCLVGFGPCLRLGLDLFRVLERLT